MRSIRANTSSCSTKSPRSAEAIPRFTAATNSDELSFRPEQADAFASRSLPVNASACGVEEPLFDFSLKIGSSSSPSP
jgi:hypothetical protein